MRILILVTDAFGGDGGIAKYNRDLLTALCNHPRCKEVVAIPRLISGPVESLPKKLTYVTSGANSKIRFVAAALKAVWKNPRFDLIICGHIHLLNLASMLRWWIRRPLLLEIFGIDAWQSDGGWIHHYFLNRIDAFVSISEVTRARFLEWARLVAPRTFLLPNGIDLSLYGAKPQNRELVERFGLRDKRVLLTLGRMLPAERYKGFDETLEALPGLIREVPNLVYVVGGEGPDRPRLMEKAAQLGISDRVVFTGFVPEELKPDYYRLADAYVMPSYGEGFGFVFLEAMACGIPVLGSRLDGGREALQNGKLGILVDPRDRVELRAGILSALGRPRGVVPEGLEVFSYRNFEKRCHLLVETLLKGKTASSEPPGPPRI